MKTTKEPKEGVSERAPEEAEEEAAGEEGAGEGGRRADDDLVVGEVEGDGEGA